VSEKPTIRQLALRSFVNERFGDDLASIDRSMILSFRVAQLLRSCRSTNRQTDPE
jgi:hypothetical protein